MSVGAPRHPALQLHAPSCMAAATICISPLAIVPMAGRRVPLSTLPNGANSPLHGPSATKRGRSAGVLDDPTHDLAPPSKKHTGEDGVTNSQTPRKAYLAAAAAANKRDAAAVERRRRQRDAEAAAAGKQERVEADSQSLEHVRQWQRHYRKAFPEFTFYFENLPREEKSECSRSIRMLGAVSYMPLVAIV